MKALILKCSPFWMSIALLYGGLVVAADEPTAEKTTPITRTETAPTIDGSLDEPIWATAQVVDDLHQVDPSEYAEPTQRTEFMLLYDADALYVGVRVFEANVDDISATILRNDTGLRFDDRVKVILDPFNDKRSGFDFQTNPHGARHDGMYKGASVDYNWNGIWEVDSQTTADGWTTEIKIPFKTLSFNEEDRWGINFVREIVRQNEKIAWSSRNGAVDPAVGGTLTGMTDLNQGMGIDIVPSLSVTNHRSFDPSGNETDAEPSLDIYYKITSGLNASLTINTDFSATEVDNRQVNLTRFGLFFPEKRSFFLRESDIFDFGGIVSNNNSTFSRADRENGRPFFSRRIGLSGSGQPVDLDVGGKVSGRIGRWNVGAMVIRQAEFEDVDASNIAVARVTANVLAESTVGFIATHGDPRSDLDNSVIGVDFQYQNSRLAKGRRLVADAWFQQSDTEDVQGDDAAFGLAVSMPNRTGWRGGAGFKEIQQNFFPAVGFVNRAGIQLISGDIGYTYRHNGELVRSIFGGIDVQRVDIIDGELQSQNTLFRLLELQTNAEDELLISYEAVEENLIQPFEISDGITIPVGNYDFGSSKVELETAGHRTANVGLGFADGDFYDGKIRSFEAEFGWRQSEHFRMSVAYSVDNVDLPSGSFETKLASTQIEAAFTNSLSWINLIQYDNVSESIGFNSRLHWSPQAGRNIYFVINHNLVERPSDRSYHSTSTDLTLKVDYTFRF